MDERATRSRRTIDRPAGDGVDHEAVDLAHILRGVAARLDTILDDGTIAQGRTSPASEVDPVAAWSSVVAEGAGTIDHHARRAALATTVLRIGTDGSLDVLGEEPGEGDPTPADGEEATDGVPSAAAAIVDDEPTSERTDVERRIRSARERLERRRAAVTIEERGSRSMVWRRDHVAKVVKRLLTAIAIVGTSAAVAVLLT